MDKNPARAMIAALMTPFLLVAACNDSNPSIEITDRGDEDVLAEFDPATTAVEVRFRDSSVPPEYHRSWEMEMDAETIALTVDSYGDVVATNSVAMSAEEWTEFLSDLPADLERWGQPEADEHSCAGGTGMSITVHDGEESAELVLDNCFDDQRAISRELVAAVGPFAELVDIEGHRAVD
ncbi:hypothetical protein [Nocardioides sp. AE5]|uniref:hypothetical protein n=1 Tax=Nocardioides sp. AE5 TaxID=2962573 RepID=UPI0028829E97|nr:hypothetical protein [Nocardioides sp. AE5]MDT0202130.1 hypothetical protein [Nocardioides sp. AE5]